MSIPQYNDYNPTPDWKHARFFANLLKVNHSKTTSSTRTSTVETICTAYVYHQTKTPFNLLLLRSGALNSEQLEQEKKKIKSYIKLHRPTCKRSSQASSWSLNYSPAAPHQRFLVMQQQRFGQNTTTNAMVLPTLLVPEIKILHRICAHHSFSMVEKRRPVLKCRFNNGNKSGI